ncbi:MAG: molybdate ABC transporter substrate-binding protein [Acidobacteriota bacterium]|nr:molybdate ABC transporter substrate-binding protein [Acidobacteriota bacterium]MDH3530522.1 molybdate ABC transporter substrate-binding protein [Acidobacteriota bacterium]
MSKEYQTGILGVALAVLVASGMVLNGGCGSKPNDEIRVAVASNFAETATRLGETFTRKSGRRVVFSSGSTGKHYAQILNGAPFDIFLSADRKHPALLEEMDIGIRGTRFTYASGRLVLWSEKPDYVDSDGKVLNSSQNLNIAIANPRLAPYGIAASEVLQKLGIDAERSGTRIVRGENVGQVFQFVDSGNADLGFIALSQLKARGESGKGSFWVVPQESYTPIEQQAVLIRDSPGAREFLRFLGEPEALELIRESGYGTP